jgi:hypothetical protein
MGVIRSGILGGVSGKIGGVVGGSWKDRKYLREYVIPANPNTTPQQAQRSKMSIGVAFGKALVGQIFNQYTDKFERGMSGFNRFIKDNMDYFLSPVTYASIILTNGKLWASPRTTTIYSTPGMSLSWTGASVGNNGAATDHVYAAVRNNTTGLWFFPAAEVHRSVGSIAVETGDVAGGTTFATYLFFAKYSLTSSTLLEMISNSSYANCTA